MSELIKLNKVFEVKKGNKISKWKVIKHPYFDDLTLVKKLLWFIWRNDKRNFKRRLQTY